MASDSSAEDERMNVGCSFVGIDSLEVRGVAQHVVLVNDAVATEHVSRLSCDGERLGTIITLDDGNHLGCELLLVLKKRDLVHGMQSK